MHPTKRMLWRSEYKNNDLFLIKKSCSFSMV